MMTDGIDAGRNGLLTLDAHATAYADTIFGVYQTPYQFLGGNYAAAIAIPIKTDLIAREITK